MEKTYYVMCFFQGEFGEDFNSREFTTFDEAEAVFFEQCADRKYNNVCVVEMGEDYDTLLSFRRDKSLVAMA